MGVEGRIPWRGKDRSRPVPTGEERADEKEHTRTGRDLSLRRKT